MTCRECYQSGKWTLPGSDSIMRRRERGNPKSPGSPPGAAGVVLVRGRPPWVVSNFSECAVARGVMDGLSESSETLHHVYLV